MKDDDIETGNDDTVEEDDVFGRRRNRMERAETLGETPTSKPTGQPPRNADAIRETRARARRSLLEDDEPNGSGTG